MNQDFVTIVTSLNSKHIKRLSPKLEDFLMDCHERELMGMPPNQASQFAAKSLEKRKFVYFKPYQNAKVRTTMCAFITQEGKEHLNGLINGKKLKDPDRENQKFQKQ